MHACKWIFVVGFCLTFVGILEVTVKQVQAACEMVCCYEGICHTNNGDTCLWASVKVCPAGEHLRATAGLMDENKCGSAAGQYGLYHCTLGSSCFGTSIDFAQGLNCTKGEFVEDRDMQLCNEPCT